MCPHNQTDRIIVNTSSKWTRALWEPAAGVQTSKDFVALIDLQGRGDYQLILVDESSLPFKLKLFKGLKPIVESALAECPTGIVGFACDSGNSDSTCLAVACGSSLLIYRNMKPYYRYNVPQRDILSSELELWSLLSKSQIQKGQLIEGLKLLQQQHSISELSHQSQRLLTFEEDKSIENIQELQNLFIDFVLKDNKENNNENGNLINPIPPPLTNVQITCISTIPRNQSINSAVDVLILGTEMGSIYFVDSQAYTVVRKDNIAAVPVKILPTGHYDLEYRIVICTRENDVFVLRKNSKGECNINSFYIREHPFNFVFATRRRRLIFYSQKCRRQNSMQFDEDIVDLEHFYYEPKQYEGVLIAIGNEINLFIDQLRVDTIKMDRAIEWIKFGRMGREEGVLVISTEGGGLCVKIFRRVATFDEGTRSAAIGIQQRKSANISSIELPKRSRTFVDQSLRERENPKLLHQIYQRNWFMVKWHSAKMFAALEGGGRAGELAAATGGSEPLQVQYELLGFGPNFRLQIKIFCSAMLLLPRLFTNKQVKFYSDVRCLHPENQHLIGEEETEVRIILMRMDRKRPIWSANFQMPVSEPIID
uniref:BBS1 domain-containing protein n=1 Tax=Meloidogyne hapla TaxID=6305 RepID=A0A1I8BAA9_MELHA